MVATGKREAAAMLGVSIRTVERLLAQGDLPCVRKLGCVRIPLSALRKLDKIPWPSKSVRALPPAPDHAIVPAAPFVPEAPVAEVEADRYSNHSSAHRGTTPTFAGGSQFQSSASFRCITPGGAALSAGLRAGPIGQSACARHAIKPDSGG
jgi:excisionase family DNA binding protein